MKETVYVETSIISYLTARPSNDLRAMANQNTTTEWWETCKPNYTIVASDLVISEASRGHTEASHRRLAAIADLSLLQISEGARALAQALIESHALPE